MDAMYTTQPPGGIIALSKVELHFEARDLANLDTMSKSDPQVYVYARSNTSSKSDWREVGRTEALKDTLNPKFARAVSIGA